MPRSQGNKKTKPKKPKTDKQAMDGLGSDFETVMQALVQPTQNKKA